jgi:hypothetical protein
MKRGALGSAQFFFCAGPDTPNDTDQIVIFFQSNDTLRINTQNTVLRETTQVFRDPSSWYHFVVAFDTTQSTANNRIKFYVNGTQVTAFNVTANPSQNADTGVNSAALHTLGKNSGSPDYYFNGYLADIHFIDGQQLDPSSFAETDAITGQWVPKAYGGSYGTNGFKLNFSDNSTTAALGTDTSGNGNTWTVNNLSVTAGSGNDSLTDTPTSYGTDTGVGGEVRGNYATLNPLDISTGGTVTLSNGNLDWQAVNGNGGIRGTFAVSTGKWYFEFTYNEKPSGGGTAFGVLNVNDALGFVGSTSGGYTYYSEGAGYTKKINNNVQTDYGVSFAPGDIIGVALDLDAGTITFYNNGASQGQAFSGLSGTFAPACSSGTGTGTARATLNAGQRAFAYTAPSGFKALVDTNLPTPTVAQGNTLMDATLWTGNGTSQTITLPGGFSPDLVWIKQRNGSEFHALFNTIVGATTRLFSNSTSAEATNAQTLTSFNSNGFSVGNTNEVNGSSNAYVAWSWDAGSSTVTNTAGSITSQVRANATAGFSVVTYSGSGSSATVGHGLGVAPQMVIVKRRNASGWDWPVWHSSLISGTYTLFLDLTDTQANRTDIWDGVPTSSVFKVNTSGQTNDGSGTYVAYCFAPVSGYSSFGAWTNNNSTDGVFIYTGMRPKFIILKNTDNVEQWFIFDSARSTYNVAYPNPTELRPNSAAAEGSYGQQATIDFLSNGFKIRGSTSSEISFGTRSYVYACFSENPFQYARAR